jgi:hypothetical protein
VPIATTIPISHVVSMQPGVIGATGNPSLLSGVVLTSDPSIPPGFLLNTYQPSNAPTDANNWFGPTSPEALAMTYYFPGIINGGQLPYTLIFASFATSATPAGSYGAQLTGVTLTQLQTYSGTLIVTVNGTLYTSTTINLSGATSFANAATLMQAGFSSPPFTISYDTQRNRFTLLTTLTGTTATSTDVSGTLAANVGLQQASGAFIALAGVAADTPASAMNRLVSLTTNFGTFTTSLTQTLTVREAFAAWNSTQNYQYAYAAWDTDAADSTPNNAASFGQMAFNTPFQGTGPLYGDITTAASVMGYAASINYNVTNGRTTLAFRQFVAGPNATCTTLALAQALESNHYTYIGAFANSANNWTVAYPGQLSGAFLWWDTYLNQIWLNKSLQLAFFEAMLAYNSLPYNQDGYTALYRAGVDVIDQAVAAGVIQSGVTLSQTEIQQVNNAAGRNISDVLQSRGWYLLIGNPTNPAQARTTRTSPQATLWYTDGGSVQQLTVQSLAVI